jgi:polar amino acid transport system substrate-binding protein
MPEPGQMPAGTYMREIQDRGKITLGVSRDTFLFGYEDPITHSFQGLDIDILREVARAIFGQVPDIDRFITFRVITSPQRIPAVQNGDVDIVGRTATATCERWQSVDFTTTYYWAVTKILVRADAPYRNIYDMRGKPVCTTITSTTIDLLNNHPARVVPVAMTEQTDCLLALQQGEVEGVASDDSILTGLAQQDKRTKILPDSYSQEPYGMLINKRYPEFTSFVNGVLARLRSDGTLQRLYERWLDPLRVNGQLPAVPSATYLD